MSLQFRLCSFICTYCSAQPKTNSFNRTSGGLCASLSCSSPSVIHARIIDQSGFTTEPEKRQFWNVCRCLQHLATLCRYEHGESQNNAQRQSETNQYLPRNMGSRITIYALFQHAPHCSIVRHKTILQIPLCYIQAQWWHHILIQHIHISSINFNICIHL